MLTYIYNKLNIKSLKKLQEFPQHQWNQNLTKKRKENKGFSKRTKVRQLLEILYIHSESVWVAYRGFV